jgi:hypothetical protein
MKSNLPEKKYQKYKITNHKWYSVNTSARTLNLPLPIDWDSPIYGNPYIYIRPSEDLTQLAKSFIRLIRIKLPDNINVFNHRDNIIILECSRRGINKWSRGLALEYRRIL